MVALIGHQIPISEIGCSDSTSTTIENRNGSDSTSTTISIKFNLDILVKSTGYINFFLALVLVSFSKVIVHQQMKSSCPSTNSDL